MLLPVSIRTLLRHKAKIMNIYMYWLLHICYVLRVYYRTMNSLRAKGSRRHQQQKANLQW